MEKISAKTGILWGSFDPPTLAHKAIIIKMLDLFQEALIIINDRSNKDYFFSIEHRTQMLHSMLSAISTKYQILIQNDKHNNDYFNVHQQITGDLYVVAGMDALQTWVEAHDINELANYDGIYIVPRASILPIAFGSLTNVFTLPIDVNYQNISSTKVRAQLFSRIKNKKQIELDSNVLAYIEQHKLYSI